LSPIIGAATGGFDFSNHFIRLSSNVSADSLAEAKKQGAVLAWGNFLTVLINFVIIAWVLFIVVIGAAGAALDHAGDAANGDPRSARAINGDQE